MIMTKPRNDFCRATVKTSPRLRLLSTPLATEDFIPMRMISQMRSMLSLETSLALPQITHHRFSHTVATTSATNGIQSG